MYSSVNEGALALIGSILNSLKNYLLFGVKRFTRMLGFNNLIKIKSIYLITGTGKAWAWQRSANPVFSTLLTWIDLYSRVNEGAFALIGSIIQMKEKS